MLILEDSKLSLDDRRNFISTLRDSPHTEIRLKGALLTQQTFSNRLALLSLLRSQWGKWRLAENEIVFDDSAAMAKFTELVAQIDEGVQQQRDFVESLKSQNH